MRHLLIIGLLLVSSLGVACTGHLPPEQRQIPSELPDADRDAARLLPLEGAHNFRDVGGYETSEGRRVRWGALYRSDKLSELTDDDVAYLSRLSLKRVIDFRSDGEYEREPDRLPAGVVVTRLPIDGSGLDPSQIETLIREGDAEATAQILVAGNEAVIREFSPQYRAFLLALAEPENLPLLFHCTGGKDRAGFGAALALLAVGVPRDVVMRDYLLTREYTAEITAQQIRRMRLMTLGSVNAEAFAALADARPEYLQAAFDTIDADYGSTQAYIRDGLRIDAATLARIRSNLLEPR
jgi:protein-tyrosine phosphatase